MAIILPQGNLNNLGAAALRRWVAGRARVLAVVGLHVNTFKPFTGTKTSVVFMQKWGGLAGDELANYPIYMAASQRSGKNNSGEYVYKHDAQGNVVDENGTPIAESGAPPASDHDLDDIANAFNTWSKMQQLSFAKN